MTPTVTVMSIQQYQMRQFLHDLEVILFFCGIYASTIIACQMLHLPRLIL